MQDTFRLGHLDVTIVIATAPRPFAWPGMMIEVEVVQTPSPYRPGRNS